LEGAGTYVSDIYFTTDLDLIVKEFGPKQNLTLTAGDLLIDFFRFYSADRFRCQSHIISISDGKPF
jgi:hypothetical protein